MGANNTTSKIIHYGTNPKITHIQNFMNNEKFLELRKYIGTVNINKTSDYGYNEERNIDLNIRKSKETSMDLKYFDGAYISNLINSAMYNNDLTKEYTGGNEYVIPTYDKNAKFKILKYTDGDFFRQHTDDNKYGNYTGIICVNAPKEGGELIFELEKKEKSIKFTDNSFVIFDKSITHSSSVVKGTKIVITFPVYMSADPVGSYTRSRMLPGRSD